MTKLTILAAAIMLAFMAAFGVACGDDNGDGNGNGGEPEATEVPADGDEPSDGEEPSNGEQPSGGGSATLTVGDEVYTFDGYVCGFGSDETRNERVSFSSSAFGESATGARTQLDVSIQDTNEGGATSGEGTIHTVTLDDVEDFENPSVSWEAVTLFGAGFEIQIDGKNISAEAGFDNGLTDEIEETPGTFEGTCP